jgi:hypothetical protein
LLLNAVRFNADVFDIRDAHLCDELIYLDSGPIFGTVTGEKTFFLAFLTKTRSPWSHLPELEGGLMFGLQKRFFSVTDADFWSLRK